MKRITRKKEAGFTLIELILVIVVLGILAVSALPSFYDVTTAARSSARDGMAGAVNAGLATYRSNALVNGTTTALAALDAVADAGTCNTVTPCFGNVLDQGATDGDWGKTNSTTYVYNGTSTFTYTPPTANSAGSFLCTAGC